MGESSQSLRALLEGGVVLRMGEDDPEAAAAELFERSFEVGGQGTVRSLDQQIVPIARERHRPQLLIRHLAGRIHGHLGARHDVQLERVLFKPLVQLIREPADSLAFDVRMVLPHVWSRNEQPGARRHRHLRHGDAAH